MKFLHTADWQVGKRATQLGEKGERVRHARLESARRVIEEARREKVDFVVVAGDTFENNGVDRLKVREVAKILGAAGCPVYLIPGNHDAVTPGSVWEDAAWGEIPNLHVLKKPEPVEVGSAILYPCPVCAGDSREDPTDWIHADPARKTTLRGSRKQDTARLFQSTLAGWDPFGFYRGWRSWWHATPRGPSFRYPTPSVQSSQTSRRQRQQYPLAAGPL
jgi:hypothetical protein